ncbi:sensor domain-containing diguanylate cyclase [Aliarcobacter cryaerophilus]|uniref:sensor domain-containing diguanylate cyclase n=1 Tax=Aliarcobacter cryaerophilus TaxID=28198 RepID=UPI000831BA21|nr:sensor domain-containing diguanylate cyclase [Aliarcobacter cryaerophilus]
MIENKKLKIINFELNLFLEQFKELSYFSETDLNGVIIDISKSFCDVIGYKKEELIGKKHSILKHPLEDENKYKDLWETIINGNIWIGELRCLDKNKKDVWYKTTIFPQKNIEGKIVAYVAKRQDITDQKLFEDLSITDTLTNLYNRRYFNEIVDREIDRAKRFDKNFIIMMIDVDNFKIYNDAFGHLNGDNVLIKIAEILKTFTQRANDYAFRLGGDEFSIITLDLHKDEVLNYANNIKNAVLEARFSKEIEISLSIGVYILELNRNLNSQDVYKFSDEALYQAKKSGKNRVLMYNDFML